MPVPACKGNALRAPRPDAGSFSRIASQDCHSSNGAAVRRSGGLSFFYKALASLLPILGGGNNRVEIQR
jgi:hypothetical protein